MRGIRLPSVSVALSLALTACASSTPTVHLTGADAGMTMTIPVPVRLTGAAAGMTIAVPVGGAIEITLQTIGPGQFGTPQLSSSAVRFERMDFAAVQNPGGPTQLFFLRCGAKGSTVVTVPRVGGISPAIDASAFVVTLDCD